MNLWFHISLDLNGVDGPGWYLSAVRKDDKEEPVYLIEPLRLNDPQLSTFSAISVPSSISVSQIVSSGSHLIKEAINQQIEEAEAIAVRVAKLKALRDAESPTETDKDVE